MGPIFKQGFRIADESDPPPSTTAPPPDDQPPPPPPTTTDDSPPPPLPASPPPKSSPPPQNSPPATTPPPNPTPPNPTPPSPTNSTNSTTPISPPPPGKSSPGSSSPSPSPPRSSTKQLSPPPPDRISDPSPPSSSGGGGGGQSSNNNLGLILGGAFLFGVIIIALIIFCARRGKKKKNNAMHYHKREDQSQSQGGDQYYNNPQHPKWHNGPDHVVKLSPGAGAPGGGWPASPPPGNMMGGDDSAMYSGPHRPPLPPPSPSLALGFNKSTFTYDELAAATGGFAQGNLLGQGGFGYVHKGVLPNGKEIAVKSLKSGSGQGEREFQAEVEIISRVHHRYLVSLVGYCIAGGQRMLVYEFVPNKTLEHHLHGKGLPVMDFSTRLKIALGSAKGLAYLHEDCHPRIIHRDIKAANILLDYSFEAKVADFGLAKLSSDNYTHVSTRVMGTFGYLAPEYASSGKLTEKSDIFSFGVMLLELLTGKRPVDPTNAMDDSLVDWARPLLTRSMEDGNYDELADPLLERNYNPQEMARMVACAAASIRHSAKKRPKMSQIVRALEGDSSLDDLNEGVRPGHSTIYGSSGSSEYSLSNYNADMKKFRQVALSSQEFPTSSEYGGSSGDSREMAAPHRHS